MSPKKKENVDVLPSINTSARTDEFQLIRQLTTVVVIRRYDETKMKLSTESQSTFTTVAAVGTCD